VEAVVIYESLTGNTAKAGRAIAAGLTQEGLPTRAFPITKIDYQALAIRRDRVQAGVADLVDRILAITAPA